MITLDDFESVKRKVEALRRARDQKIGELTQIKARLKKEFDCDSLQAAKELLKQLTQEEADLAAQWSKQLKQFKAKYKSLLDPDQ